MTDNQLQFIEGLKPWEPRNLELRLGGDPGLLLVFTGDYVPPDAQHVTLGFGGATEAVELPRSMVVDATLRPPVMEGRLEQGQARELDLSVALYAPVASLAAEVYHGLKVAPEIPALQVDIAVDHGVSLSMTASLSGPSLASIELSRDINVFRGPEDKAASAFEDAGRVDGGGANGWEQSARRSNHAASRYEVAAKASTSHSGAWAYRPREDAQGVSAWEMAARVAPGVASPEWVSLPRVDASPYSVWEEGGAVGDSQGVSYRYPPRNDAVRLALYQEARNPGPVYKREVSQQGRSVGGDWLAPWQEARQPPPGIDEAPTIPDPPGVEPWVGDTTLQFCAPMPTAPWVLQFGLTCDDIPSQPTIPVRRLYIVQNSARLTRISDGQEIPATQMSLSIDSDSWSWSFSAGLAGRGAEAFVEGADGEPVEVLAEINGNEWRLLIDGWRLSESWQSHSVTVSGRSLAAYLSSPYALTRSYAEGSQATAYQLAMNELPSGWTLDWQLTDWIVPAGVWSYDNLAPIDAIARIAEAAGGYIQAHPSESIIQVLPRFPAAPWAWGDETPSAVIPRDVLTQLSSSRDPGDPRNGVWLHGDTGGIQARVIRRGTAGDSLASTVVDSLITERAPAEARGIAAIADTLRQSSTTIEMPVSDDLGGLFLPGNLVEIDGARSMTRGVSIQASLQGRALSVRQSVELQSFHLTAEG